MSALSWSAYISRVSESSRTDADIAERCGVFEATIGRWTRGATIPEPRVAIAYEDSPPIDLEAAGYLTRAERQDLNGHAAISERSILGEFASADLIRELARRMNETP